MLSSWRQMRSNEENESDGFHAHSDDNKRISRRAQVKQCEGR